MIFGIMTWVQTDLENVLEVKKSILAMHNKNSYKLNAGVSLLPPFSFW